MLRFAAGCLRDVPGMVPWGENQWGIFDAHKLRQSSFSPDTSIISTRFSANNWRYINTADFLLTDTSVKRTPRVGRCLSLMSLFDSL